MRLDNGRHEMVCADILSMRGSDQGQVGLRHSCQGRLIATTKHPTQQLLQRQGTRRERLWRFEALQGCSSLISRSCQPKSA